jgi:transposase
LARWNAGCRTGVQLFAELQQQGYPGKRSTVLNYITRLRKAQGLAPRRRSLLPTRPVSDPAIHPLTPRRATWLVLQRPEKCTARDSALIARLQQAHPVLAAAIALAQQFAQLLRTRTAAQFDRWLHQARNSGVAAFHRFARSLHRDSAAVKAGMTLPWSTSPVEGHINRLKLLKRQMFGRAKLDLLAIRMLHAP